MEERVKDEDEEAGAGFVCFGQVTMLDRDRQENGTRYLSMREMSCRQALAVSSSDIRVPSRVSCSSTSPFSLSISLFTACRRFLSSGSSFSCSCTMVLLGVLQLVWNQAEFGLHVADDVLQLRLRGERPLADRAAGLSVLRQLADELGVDGCGSSQHGCMTTGRETDVWVTDATTGGHYKIFPQLAQVLLQILAATHLEELLLVTGQLLLLLTQLSRDVVFILLARCQRSLCTVKFGLLPLELHDLGLQLVHVGVLHSVLQLTLLHKKTQSLFSSTVLSRPVFLSLISSMDCCFCCSFSWRSI
ncbi:hypothetical protein INR49_008979 [Caranx melampygus]|nr:hypothetical protein INR49_008979 [Caranx melampygus]